jgi:hypothetical protein
VPCGARALRWCTRTCTEPGRVSARDERHEFGRDARARVSYTNALLFYSRDGFKGANGDVVGTGNNAVILAMNSFVWVGKTEILGGARFSMSATLPISNNSLTSNIVGPISGGGGFGDSYYQPLILGWQSKRAAIRAVYGFLAPTGRFEAGATSNVGSGYWTHVLSSGQTWSLTSDDTTCLSAFQMYEFHTTQRGTHVHPGDTLDLDYSLTRTIFGARRPAGARRARRLRSVADDG